MLLLEIVSCSDVCTYLAQMLEELQRGFILLKKKINTISGPLQNLCIYLSLLTEYSPPVHCQAHCLFSQVCAPKPPQRTSFTQLPYIKCRPSPSLSFLWSCFIFLHKISSLSPPDIFVVIFVFICLPPPEWKVQENRDIICTFIATLLHI